MSFLDDIKHMANLHRERCKTNPVLRANMERGIAQRSASRAHKEWVEDFDIHGPLDSYCKRRGVWDAHYRPGSYHTKQAFMTCDEIRATKEEEKCLKI